MRRFGLLLIGLALAPLVNPSDARAAVAVVVVDGRGWGHGVGMAQDGAFWMGASGRTHDEILDHFYPGTTRGSATGRARVVVHTATEPRVVLDFPDGGELRSPRSGPQRAGFPVHVAAGGTATISFDGSTYRVEAGGGSVSSRASGPRGQVVQLPTSSTTSTSTSSTTSTTSGPLLPLDPTTTTTAPPSTTTTAPGGGGGGGAPGGPAPSPPPGVSSPEPVWAGPVSSGASIGVPARGFRYRGELEVSAAGGPLRIVNDIDIEQYLWGLAEVSASWSPAALRAQVIAARTYALRAMAANGEICDTQRCQVYKGRNGEFPGQVDAVNATLGTTLGWNGRYASAVFSANAAGISATPSEGFGTPDETHPYLVARPYESQSEDPWEVRIALSDLATRLGYPGTATSVRVASTGASGRALTVELDGDAGKVVKPALEADAAMGLRSTMWTLRVVQSDVAPPPPDAKSLVQVAPDEVGAVIAEETARAVRASRFDEADEDEGSAMDVEVPNPSAGDDSGLGWGWLLAVPVVLAGLYGLRQLRRHHP